jgi:hypothetical protein
LVNEERARAGAAPLSSRDDVAREAAAHSERMARRGEIFHNDDFFTAATKARLGAKAAGENVAFNGSVEDAHARLMASPGHRANILSRDFSVVGIALVRRDGSWYITQDFIKPVRVASAAPAPAKIRTTPVAVATASNRPAPAPPASASAPAAPETTAVAPEQAVATALETLDNRPGAVAAHAGAVGPRMPVPVPVAVALTLLLFSARGLLREAREHRSGR